MVNKPFFSVICNNPEELALVVELLGSLGAATASIPFSSTITDKRHDLKIMHEGNKDDRFIFFPVKSLFMATPCLLSLFIPFPRISHPSVTNKKVANSSGFKTPLIQPL